MTALEEVRWSTWCGSGYGLGLLLVGGLFLPAGPSSQIRLTWPCRIVVAPPPAPTYTRIPRTPDENASRLGFHVGRAEQSIRLSQHWAALAFNVPTAHVVGRIDTSLAFDPLEHSRMELALFDAFGSCVLRVEMTSHTMRFDQRRLAAGDYLLCYRGPGIRGEGSHQYPHALLLAGALPERPSLDAILADEPDATLGRCAVPQFKFSSR